MRKGINSLIAEVKGIIRAYAADAAETANEGESWITLSSGTHVQVDGDGNIIKGAKGLQGQNVGSLPSGTNTTKRPLRGDAIHEAAYEAMGDISEEETQALRDYTYSSGDINDALRSRGYTTSGLDKTIDGIFERAEPIQRAVELHRILQDGSFLDGYDVGDVFSDSGYTSTSSDGDFLDSSRESIESFPAEYKENFRTMSITVPPGGKMLSVFEYSPIPEQSEILLPRGSTFKITDITDGHYAVEVVLDNDQGVGGGALRDAMRRKDRIALDGSARRFDTNGYLHVAASHISKETVNPYYGSEIMDSGEGLKLDPDKLYYGYRPGDELSKGAATFNGLPLLFEHHDDSAASPKKDYRVGSLGTDAVFNAPYLDNSLIVTDAMAIAAIENGDYKELSSAYRYKPDFTPGEFRGQKYDFIMRDIIGNHVALVQEGRAGRDVAVADAQIKNKGDNKGMDKMKELIGKLLELLGGYSVEDVEPGAEEAVEETFAGAEEDVYVDEPLEDEGHEQKTAMDDLMEAVAAIEDPELAEKLRALIGAVGQDEETVPNAGVPEEGKAQDRKGKKRTAALDANAIKKAVEKSMREKHAAARDCAPLCGDIVDPYAFDSASDIYKKALELVGVDVSKYAPSAYRGMVDMLKASGSRNTFSVADSKAKTSVDDKYFTGLDNIRIAG